MLYHECNGSHPGTCPGCTTDRSKHGKPVAGEMRGIEVESVTVGPPTVIPVTDVGVAYDGTPLTITLPRYLDRHTIERHLRNICKGITPYEYRCHTWRNAVKEPQQRDL